MTTQFEALRLSDALNCATDDDCGYCQPCVIAAELRRLHTLNGELLEALKELLGNPAGDYDTTDNYDNACKKAEAVIAKSEK
jgi:hypothetical protein